MQLLLLLLFVIFLYSHIDVLETKRNETKRGDREADQQQQRRRRRRSTCCINDFEREISLNNKT